jgi:hypothetical protein
MSSTVLKITDSNGIARFERHPLVVKDRVPLPDGTIVEAMPATTHAPWAKHSRLTEVIAKHLPPPSEGSVSAGQQPTPTQIPELEKRAREIVKQGEPNPPTIFRDYPLVHWYARTYLDLLRASGLSRESMARTARERFSVSEVADEVLTSMAAEAYQRGYTKAGTWVIEVAEAEERRKAYEKEEAQRLRDWRAEEKKVIELSQRAGRFFLVSFSPDIDLQDRTTRMFWTDLGTKLHGTPLRSPKGDGWRMVVVPCPVFLEHDEIPNVGSAMVRIESSTVKARGTKAQIKEAEYRGSLPTLWMEAIMRSRESTINNSPIEPVDLSTPRGKAAMQTFRDFLRSEGSSMFADYGAVAGDYWSTHRALWAAQWGCRVCELSEPDACEILAHVAGSLWNDRVEKTWVRRLEDAASGRAAWVSPGEGAPPWIDANDPLGDSFGSVLRKLVAGKDRVTLREAQSALCESGAATMAHWSNAESRRTSMALFALGFDRKVERSDDGSVSRAFHRRKEVAA